MRLPAGTVIDYRRTRRLDLGRRLLTLDTATAEAARLYQRLGWTVAGVIPHTG